MERILYQLHILSASQHFVDLCYVLLEYFFIRSFEILLTVFLALAEVDCQILIFALARRRVV